MDTIPQDDFPRKQCKDCKDWFPATTEFFNQDKGKKYGVRNQCRKCRNKARRIYPLPEPCPEGYQRCTQCKLPFPTTTEYFYANKIVKDGLRSECKTCHDNYIQTHNARPDVILIQMAKRRTPKYRQQHSHSSKKWNQTHKEAVRVMKKVSKSRRRALKYKNGGRHTANDIHVQLKRQKGRCYYCNATLGKGKNAYHVDHIVPITRGGSDNPDNIVLACPTCNMKKHNRLPHEWPEGGRLL